MTMDVNVSEKVEIFLFLKTSLSMEDEIRGIIR